MKRLNPQKTIDPSQTCEKLTDIQEHVSFCILRAQVSVRSGSNLGYHLGEGARVFQLCLHHP